MGVARGHGLHRCGRIIYLADRRKDLIVTGGANVYPAEVEGILDAHPAVVASAVVGEPDDDLGERVHAFVELDQAVGADELTDWVSAHLARYKVPRAITVVDGPLRDEAGKVRRSALLSRFSSPFSPPAQECTKEQA